MSHFDSQAPTWDENPKRSLMINAIAEALRSHLPLREDFRVMDYGCGTGELSLAILPWVGYVEGIDTSKGMIDRFSQKIQERSLPNIKAKFMRAGEALEGEFDLVVCNMVLHHIPDPLLYIRQFESSIRSGGHLAIIDLDKEDGSFHPQGTPGVFHQGFSYEEIRAWLDYCYLEERLHHPSLHLIQKNEREYPLTLTLAQKPH